MDPARAEPDSAQADRLIVEAARSGERLIVLDLALIEVANAIGVRQHRGLTSPIDAQQYLQDLLAIPLHVEPADSRLRRGFEIAQTHDRAVHDALFVALVEETGSAGVTADEPLDRAVHADFPQVILLRNWSP
ncbi:MAG TPA: type II toxin-antitoxin system VapC family toxin [Isosphaeraceae bacterium]|jgi:predicted nucleic acid-binding protein